MSQEEIEAENDRNWPEWRSASTQHFVLALCGEIGELANVTKKYLRWKLKWKGSYLDEAQFKEALKDELADIQIYLALIAGKYSLNLEEIVRKKQKINRKRFSWEKP